MAFTITQRARGRKPTDGDSASNEVPYIIRGNPSTDDSEELALIALRAYVPSTLGGLVLTECTIEERVDFALFLGSAKYASSSRPGGKETGESTFSFDTTGGTFKITQSKATTPWPSSAPSLQGAIGATSDSVEGVEITVPQYAFSETHFIADADVTATYVGIIYSLTGTKCSASFKGAAAGEMLFLGARGQKRGRGDWEITYNFAGSPSITGLTIGSITGIAKVGWDYLWVSYEKKEVGSGATKRISMIPRAVYTEKVYDDGNFALLGIGV